MIHVKVVFWELSMTRIHHVFLLSILGCSSDKMPDMLGDPPSAKDGGTTQTKDSGGGCSLLTPVDGGSDGGLCGSLPLCGFYITRESGAGNAPTPAGGTIVDGIYRLTSAHEYGAGNSITVQQTLEIKNMTMHFTTQQKGGSIENDAFTYMLEVPEGGTTATSIRLSSICGGAISSRDYTATTGQITLSGPGSNGIIVDVFTKQ